MHRVVIVGGGAGGLELATRLGDRSRRHPLAVTLVDTSRTHIWKPLLHEVAAGSMDVHSHQIDYLAQARRHRYTFSQGALESLNRADKTITISPVLDQEGQLVIPRRCIQYDTLVIAIGAVANSFNVPGVDEYAISLESAEDADRFHRRLVNACLKANYAPHGAMAASPMAASLQVVIVGGGATGVELAAELHNTTRMLAGYGLRNIDPKRYVQITIVNADARLLTMLPVRISDAATDTLLSLGVSVLCGEQVIEVTQNAVRTRGGRSIPFDLAVWAAGIRGHPVLATLNGLGVNRLNQLVVRPTLQTTLDDDVFAMGDCSSCPQPHTPRPVPATAQAAHQQAALLEKNVIRRLRGEALSPFRYRDFGTLVSLGKYTTVGTLMGIISGKSMRVEGAFARFMYVTLYRQHLYALYGFLGVLLDTIARLLKRGTEPRVKLH